MKLHEKLQHLSLESVEDLMRLYYSGDKATNEIIGLFNINISPSRLYTLFPPEELDDRLCPHCDSKMIVNRPSKTNYPKNNNTPFCSTCGHKENYSCKCDKCISDRELKLKRLKEEKERKDLEKRKLIELVYCNVSHKPINIDSLEFEDKVYLGSLLRFALSEDMSNILPLESMEGSLAPGEIKYDIIRYLYSKNIITVHPMSSLSAFKEGEDFPNTFYINLVNYHLNIKYDVDKSCTINEILNSKMLKEEIQINLAYNMWKQIALQECLEYLDYQMKKVGFSFNPGEKTNVVFNDLLDNFSVSQIYGIIYKSITNATRYYQENKITKKQAANSVITRCQGFGERAFIEQWQISKYSRLKDLPQSCLSEFLFNKVLKIGSKGFDEIPSIEIIECEVCRPCD
ncbi:hypothetical protein [Faecalimicrobium dakarense]|uniref:hypothetical protein n=1 Tax=Faecalimicrobium dakarense TaxID=1301100 RepID=UPI0004BC7B3A|nr:hypothetical protein [[Clostridium] dakarense]